MHPLCFVILARNTHGTYFSCPSLEISSTSFSKRLSIAISTAKRDAILEDFGVPLGRMGRAWSPHGSKIAGSFMQVSVQNMASSWNGWASTVSLLEVNLVHFAEKVGLS